MFTLACGVKAHEERKFHTCGTGRSATSGSHPRRTSNGRGGSMDADMRGDESRQKMRTYRQWDSPPPPPSPPPRVPRRSFTSQRGMESKEQELSCAEGRVQTEDAYIWGVRAAMHAPRISMPAERTQCKPTLLEACVWRKELTYGAFWYRMIPESQFPPPPALHHKCTRGHSPPPSSPDVRILLGRGEGGWVAGWVGEDDSELPLPERSDYGPLPPDPPTYKIKKVNPKTKPTTSSKQGTQHPTRP